MTGNSTHPATVLVSGGLDSAVLLHYVAKKLTYHPLHALSFHYGQRHARELDMARAQVQALPKVVDHRIVDISFFSRLVGTATALVADGTDVPDLDSLSQNQLRQPPTYVPNRNMILLSLAAAYAESKNCNAIFYGAQQQDRYGYWDCTPDFVERLNRVLALNRRKPVTVYAPFARMKKEEEIRLGLELGVDFGKTWSCYRGGSTPCGTCPTCVERRRAFEEAGAADPLVADEP